MPSSAETLFFYTELLMRPPVMIHTRSLSPQGHFPLLHNWEFLGAVKETPSLIQGLVNNFLVVHFFPSSFKGQGSGHKVLLRVLWWNLGVYFARYILIEKAISWNKEGGESVVCPNPALDFASSVCTSRLSSNLNSLGWLKHRISMWFPRRVGHSANPNES